MLTRGCPQSALLDLSEDSTPSWGWGPLSAWVAPSLLRVKGRWGQAWLHLGQAGADNELQGQGQGQSGHSTWSWCRCLDLSVPKKHLVYQRSDETVIQQVPGASTEAWAGAPPQGPLNPGQRSPPLPCPDLSPLGLLAGWLRLCL